MPHLPEMHHISLLQHITQTSDLQFVSIKMSSGTEDPIKWIKAIQRYEKELLHMHGHKWQILRNLRIM
jgi:hypothetical protein